MRYARHLPFGVTRVFFSFYLSFPSRLPTRLRLFSLHVRAALHSLPRFHFATWQSSLTPIPIPFMPPQLLSIIAFRLTPNSLMPIPVSLMPPKIRLHHLPPYAFTSHRHFRAPGSPCIGGIVLETYVEWVCRRVRVICVVELTAADLHTWRQTT